VLGCQWNVISVSSHGCFQRTGSVGRASDYFRRRRVFKSH
jgi:hypothetical protein